jgi:hypothetical protein
MLAGLSRFAIGCFVVCAPLATLAGCDIRVGDTGDTSESRRMSTCGYDVVFAAGSDALSESARAVIADAASEQRKAGGEGIAVNGNIQDGQPEYGRCRAG